jgi:hypothetical protein
MPTITVTADPGSSQPNHAPVLLSETVQSVHLSTDHAAAQLIERLAWAVSDAEDAEGADGWDFSRRGARPAQPQRRDQQSGRRSGSRARERHTTQV